MLVKIWGRYYLQNFLFVFSVFIIVPSFNTHFCCNKIIAIFLNLLQIIWDTVCCEFCSTKCFCLQMLRSQYSNPWTNIPLHVKFPKYHGRQNYQQLALWAFDACATLCLLMHLMCSSQPVHQMENIETTNQREHTEHKTQNTQKILQILFLSSANKIQHLKEIIFWCEFSRQHPIYHQRC